jgi:hypothetical protein
MKAKSPRRSAIGAVALIAALSAAHWAHAAPTIWRCGNIYSDRPCEGGKSLEAEPTPSAERRKEVDEATRKNMAMGNAMERERLKSEAVRNAPVIIAAEKRETTTPKAAAVERPAAKKTKAAKAPTDNFTAIYSSPTETPEKKKKKTSASAAS